MHLLFTFCLWCIHNSTTYCIGPWLDKMLVLQAQPQEAGKLHAILNNLITWIRKQLDVLNKQSGSAPHLCCKRSPRRQKSSMRG